MSIEAVRSSLEPFGLAFELSDGTVEPAGALVGTYISSDPGSEIYALAILQGKGDVLLDGDLTLGYPLGTDRATFRESLPYFRAFLSAALPTWTWSQPWLDSALAGVGTEPQVTEQKGHRISLEAFRFDKGGVNMQGYILTVTSTSVEPEADEGLYPEVTPISGWAHYEGPPIDFYYPPDWTKTDEADCPQPTCLLSIISPDEASNIRVLLAPIEPSPTLEEYDEGLWEARQSMLEGWGTEDTLKLESKEAVKIAGVDAVKRVFSQSMPTDTGTIERRYLAAVYFVIGPIDFAVILASDSQEHRADVADEFEAILQSMSAAY